MNYKITLFGILTIVFAHFPYGIAECHQYPGISNFSSERYFEGTWYVTHSKNRSGAMVCQEYQLTLLPVGTLDHRTYGYMENQNVFYKISCIGADKGNEGKYALACRQITDNEKSHIFHIDGAVIETDYDNFAIICTCVTNALLTADNILVLHRELDGNYSMAEEALLKRNMSMSDFTSRKNSKCKIHPDIQNVKRKIH